jgi:hypothetical protein
VERLDALWWRLSEQDQAAYKTELASAPMPSSPEELNLLDCEVKTGEQAAPLVLNSAGVVLTPP